MTPTPLLRAPEVAERLGVSPNRAYALMASGDLPGVVRLGRSVRLPADALDRFIARGGTVATIEPGAASN